MAAAISRTVWPSANLTAIWLSAAVSPRAAATKLGSMRGGRPRLGNQYQHGDALRPQVRLPATHGFDMHHELRRRGRAAQHHRSTDGRTDGRERVGHQPLKTALVVRHEGMEQPAPVRQPIALPQDVPGAVIGRHDLAAPVQLNDAELGVVEQGRHGRTQRPGAGQRMVDADKLSEMGQQPFDHLQLWGPPAVRGDRVSGD